MTIKLSSLEFKAKLPELPRTLPVYALSTPSLGERKPALERLGAHLKLGKLRAVDLDHGTVLASANGDITCFHASGAIWARDAMATREGADELRKWEGQTTSRTPGWPIALNATAARRLLVQATELLEPLGLLGKEVSSRAVQLEQVAQLDAKGKERARGAGQATIKFGYAVDGVPVRGAGGKTLAFAEPEASQARFAGVFHAWRPMGGASTLKLTALESALGVGLLNDPELDRFSAAGHKIRVTRLDFVYMALPAFVRQSHLFPMFQVEGEVSEGKLGIGFHFGRYHHAAAPRAYAAAGLYAPYLGMNPDGIAPADARRAVR